jgi:hypothetical protein
VQIPLISRYYPVDAIGNISLAKSLASLVLGPLQTLAFVVLTIMLFRRGLRLGTAS